MVPQEIDRISMPSREAFFEQFVFPQRPVVITDLFDGQDVASVKTVDEALAAWGSMKIRLQPEYTRAEGAAAPADTPVMSFEQYVALSASDPSTALCCTEYDTPARVLSAFRLPPVCQVTGDAADEIFGLPRKYGDFDLLTALFVANRGNVAHLHFDGDQREVLLHQVYGHKRVILFPPASAIHLRTLDGPFTRPSLAGVYLEHMGVDDKLSAVARAGGYHTILAPGETIYIPMLMWHHLEYLDDAMSFNIRFGRSRYGRFLSLDNFHRDPYIQNVAAKMVGPENVLRTFAPVIEQIKAEYTKAVPDIRTKVGDVRALFRRLCAELCPEACAERLCPPEREQEQITRIVEGNDMRGGFKYADPALVATTRPVGPITSRQHEVIRFEARRCGYSDQVLQSVLSNKLGKATLDALTRAEAAQLVAYLATPGAAW